MLPSVMRLLAFVAGIIVSHAAALSAGVLMRARSSEQATESLRYCNSRLVYIATSRAACDDARRYCEEEKTILQTDLADISASESRLTKTQATVIVNAVKTKKLRVVIDVERLPDQERRIELIQRPRLYMFARRFRPDDVERWRVAAKKLGLNDTEFIERIMDAAASAVMSMDK